MPAPEISNLKQYAVLWTASTIDRYGKQTVEEPVEIRVRWEKAVLESSDPRTTVQSSPTEVFVDREVAIGSLLWLGRLRDLPTTPTELMRVTGYDVVYDVKGRFAQRTLTLIRHGDTLPE